MAGMPWREMSHSDPFSCLSKHVDRMRNRIDTLNVWKGSIVPFASSHRLARNHVSVVSDFLKQDWERGTAESS